MIKFVRSNMSIKQRGDYYVNSSWWLEFFLYRV